MDLLNRIEAKRAINNFYTFLRQMSKDFGKSRKKKYTGGSGEARKIVEMMRNSIGDQYTGSALEEARKLKEFRDPYFYYETVRPDILDFQDDTNNIFEYDLKSFIDELLKQWPEPPKPTPEDVKQEYRTTRRQLQQLIRRCAKKGIDVSDFGIKVPKIPKRITEASIRRLVKEIAKVKQIR